MVQQNSWEAQWQETQVGACSEQGRLQFSYLGISLEISFTGAIKCSSEFITGCNNPIS